MSIDNTERAVAYDDHFEDGYEAFWSDGASCPHERGTPEAEAWEAGYEAAREERA